jgi:hypothetical protein
MKISTSGVIINYANVPLPRRISVQDANEFYAQQLYSKRSRAVELLISSGPDFIPNRFDVVLLCTPRSQVRGTQVNGPQPAPMVDLFADIYKDSKLFGQDFSNTKMMGDSAAFMVRVLSIEVPMEQSDTFELPFIMYKIRKVRSKVNFKRKATMTIRMDEPLFFATFLNLMSNNNNVTLEFGKKPALFAPFTTTALVSNAASFKGLAEQLVVKPIRVDLIVRHQSLHPNPFRDALSEVDGNTVALPVNAYAGLPQADQPMWVFEDVNFLGLTSDIQFSRDSAATLDGTFDFLFRRLYRLDMQKKNQVRPDNLGVDISGEGESPSKLQGDTRWRLPQAKRYNDSGLEAI